MPTRSSILLIALAVFGIHAWLLLGPAQHWSMPSWAMESTPRTVQAVWLPPPLPAPTEPPATPAPPPRALPVARPSPQKPVPPPPPPARTVPEPASSAIAAPAAPEPTITAEAEIDAAATSEPAAPPADTAPATQSGPALQVHSANGQVLDWQLPTDGSALSSNMSLRYKVQGFVKGMEYHAHAELDWQADAQQYHARQSISAFLLGSMEQTSTGRMTELGLQPQAFTDRRFTKRRRVDFDWATEQALFTPERPAAAIGPGAQDRLSVFLQLAAMLQAMPELREPGTRIRIPTLGSRSLQQWLFVVQAPELLELPDGATPTLRLQRLPDAGDDETALLWIDAARGYVPVRIRMEESNGDVMDLTLKP